MKKIFIAAICVIAATSMFVSCGKSAPKANLKNDVDTLSYAIGLAQTQGLREYLVGRMGMDTAYVDDFVKGLMEGVNAGEDKKQAAYFAGIQIGQQIGQQMIPGINHEVFGNDSTQTISLNNFMAGFVAGATNKGALMTTQEAQMKFQMKMQDIKSKMAEEKYADNKKAGEKWLAENAKKEGVKTLPSGLQYKVLEEGTGAVAADTSVVELNYEGKLIDGTVFDSSFERGQSVTMRPTQVVPGFKEALLNMPVGSVWEVYIPQELGYKGMEQGQIKPFSTLVFKIQILGLK